ncbi:MAG: hypothetical protein P8M61_07235 [Crocinitomicaceae bacterium]|nr:hypothetical protein [Crocinitomicaceae bacterium]
MTNNLTLLLKKYSVPALFLLLAFGMIFLVFASPQNKTFLIATVMMFIAGILTLLYSSGVISTKILTLLGGVAFVGAIGTLYFSTASVVNTNRHIKKYNMTYGKATYNLQDIRTAQKAYMEENAYYAATWDDLIDFINNGKVPFVEMEGTVPSRRITEDERAFLYGDNRAIDNNMTELEALRLSKRPNPGEGLSNFRRDTVMVSFLQSKFQTRSYTEARQVAGYGAFSTDSLPYIPGTKKKWNLETKKKVKLGETEYPVIKVSGKLPLAKIEGTQPEELTFGSLTTNDTGGSWEGN